MRKSKIKAGDDLTDGLDVVIFSTEISSRLIFSEFKMTQVLSYEFIISWNVGLFPQIDDHLKHGAATIH